MAIDQSSGRIFGRGVAFPPRVGPDGRIAFSEGPDNVRESIQIILLTEQGERLMRPSWGASLGAFLAEPNTATTHRLIQERIVQSLTLFEPRIRIREVRVGVDPEDTRRAIATIDYQLVANTVQDSIAVAVEVGG